MIVFRTTEEFLGKASPRCGGDRRNKTDNGFIHCEETFEGVEGEKGVVEGGEMREFI